MSSFAITIAGGPHFSLGPGITEPPRTRFRPAPTGMCFPPVTALIRFQFSVGCTMNRPWKKKQLHGRPIVCGLQRSGNGGSVGMDGIFCAPRLGILKTNLELRSVPLYLDEGQNFLLAFFV